MATLKSNEKSYLKTKTSNTQLLIPAAGAPPPKEIKNLQKIDKFIAKNYPVSLLKIGNKTILDMSIDSAKLNNINNFKLISGYKSDYFKKFNSLKIIKNFDFEKNTQLDSIIMGLDPLIVMMIYL